MIGSPKGESQSGGAPNLCINSVQISDLLLKYSCAGKLHVVPAKSKRLKGDFRALHLKSSKLTAPWNKTEKNKLRFFSRTLQNPESLQCIT